MTDVIAQVRFSTPGGAAINTFNFHATSYATYALHAADAAAALVTFYTTDGGGGTTSIGAYMAAWVSRGGEIRCYNRDDPKPRVPLITPITLPNAHAGTINHVPMDTALCLSYHAAPPVTRRRRGRIYIFGIQNEWMNSGALGTPPSFQTGVGTPALRVSTQAASLMSHAAGWSIWSTPNGSSARITGGYIDSEPDTQRRRGSDTSSRITWGV